MGTSTSLSFDLPQILRILPHRAPFVLLDRVIDIQPRKSARALKCVTYNEPFFPGHFPGKPIFPGVLMLEALAQLIGVLAYASEPFDSNQKIMYFMGIDKARFRRPVLPGDQLILKATLERSLRGIWKFSTIAEVDGEEATSAEMMVAPGETK